MKKIVLANRDYTLHTTDEGMQLQRGFDRAGWQLVGPGFDDGSLQTGEIYDPAACRDVRRIVAKLRPDLVFVQDKRDWDWLSPGSFDKAISYVRTGILADHPEITRIGVVKDAGSDQRYQKESMEEIDANLILIYYHEKAVITQSPWLNNYRLLRIYHTVNGDLITDKILANPARAGTVLSGAISDVYPLRKAALDAASFLQIGVKSHPRYGNRGCATPAYLVGLSGFKVHIATASMYGFALRKIIESVAAGSTPITDLPAFDVLPEIDEALVRVKATISMPQLREVIREAEAKWSLERAVELSRRCRRFYDWRAMGLRTDAAIMEAIK